MMMSHRSSPMPTSKPTARKNAVRTILGIDPGLARTGFGVIRGSGHDIQLITYGCIETDATTDKNNRLAKIYTEMNQLLNEHQPDLVAIEELFFAKNVTTAFRVGEARGVILLAVEQHQRPFQSFTPQFIKQSLTTSGRADKKQMQQMVKLLFKLKTVPEPDDAADAIACAVCGMNV